jgi:predicted membrane protein (TIGR00267 family)
MFENFKTYSKITNVWSIARRYFVNNFYDGMLTVLGILLGFFVFILKGEQLQIESIFIIFTSLGSSISMLISGLTGSYLSERAEQRKSKYELDRAMILNNIEEVNEVTEEEIEEIKKALIEIKKYRRVRRKTNNNKKKVKTVQERAELFAAIIVSIVNGISPFLGGFVPLIPFLYIPFADFMTFINSFLIVMICIVLLGVFLGIISRDSIIKNIIQMVFAFILTILISLFFLG